MNIARKIKPKEGNQIPVRKSKKKMNKHEQPSKQSYPHYIGDFEKFLFQLNYAETSIDSHKRRGRKFCRTLELITGIKMPTLLECKHITPEIVTLYEHHLLNKVQKNKLKPYSAYCDLKTVRLFMKFLHFNKIVNFKYDIPKDMIEPTTRSNLYIESQTIIQLAETIALRENAFSRYRNFAYLLLLVETGCRVVEASSILITDIKFSEKTIQLRSVKSGARTLQLNDFVLKVLKQYTTLREKLKPKTNHLFLKRDGSKSTPTHLSSLLIDDNKKAFGYLKVNARALRHTYITNAIDNDNDIVSLSPTMGHKHWVSTMHYLHRDKKRLLKNTLPFNPISRNFKEEIMNAD